MVLCAGRNLSQLGFQRLHIVIHPSLCAGQGIKITIIALFCTEGDVDVQPQFFLVFFQGGGLLCR